MTRAVQPTDIEGYLEFVARQRRQAQDSKVSPVDRISKETIFEENLALEMDGYAYHPNLLEFAAAGLFGLIQHDFREQRPDFVDEGGADGTVLEFDLTGNVLKKKKYPGTLFARRSRKLEPRTFRSSVETTTNSYGVLWQYLSKKVPTRFQFSHNDVRLDPLDPVEREGGQKNTNYRFETGYNFSDYNALSFTYDRESVSERLFDLDYDTDELTLGHILDFGDRHRHRLDSDLNYYRQTGSFDIERVRWRENLRMQHSDTLRSRYRFEALDRTHGSLTGIPPIKERSYYLSGTLEHRLYESLVSQLRGFAQTQDFEAGAQIDRYGVAGSLDYSKRNPLGVFRAGYGVRFEREDRAGGPVAAEVRDESHTFQDPEPVTLRKANIDTGSIVITAEDEFTFYRLGSDYTVRTLGDRIEIERIATGRIADGETVLVDYVFDLGGAFTLDTVNQDVFARHDFDFGLSPFYRLRWQHQSLSPQTATGVLPEEIRAHTVGADFRHGSFGLGAEYEDHDSTINPFEAVRLRGTYSHHFKIGSTGSLSASWSNVTFRGPQARDTTFLTVQGRYRHPITRNLTVEGALIYRESDDTIRGPDEGVDVDLSLEWFIRRTELRITYEFGQFEDSFAKNDSSTFYLQLRRRF